jgi:predicted nuclease with TOPRIM domain
MLRIYKNKILKLYHKYYLNEISDQRPNFHNVKTYTDKYMYHTYVYFAAMNVYKSRVDELAQKVRKDEINHKKLMKSCEALQQSFISLQIEYNDLKNEYEQTFNHVKDLQVQSEEFTDANEDPIKQQKIYNEEQKGLEDIIDGLSKVLIFYKFGSNKIYLL